MKKILLILLVLPIYTKSQIITTVAGNGFAGYSGDGVSATSVEINHPWGVAVDNIGNVFIADVGNNLIRKVYLSGIITTYAGIDTTSGFTGDGGLAVSAELNLLYGITVDNWGNVYIVDGGNVRIRKINTSGIINTIAGNGIEGYSGDGGPATDAELNGPVGICVDRTGNVYIADHWNNRIRKIDTTGIITTVAGNGFAAGTSGGGFSGDGGPATSAKLWQPYGVDVDAFGNIYIADTRNQRIRKVSSSGVITTISGGGTSGYGDGGSATDAELTSPDDVKVDGNGDVYIADAGTNRIRKVSMGIISTYAGDTTTGFIGDGGPATTASLSGTTGIAIDGSGNLYIADDYNNRIRRVGWWAMNATELLTTKNITIYPNPVAKELTISSSDKITSVAISNLIGQTLYSNYYHREQVRVDVSNFPAGIYFIRINGTEARKFVKE